MRRFTVAEANALLPRLEELLADIFAARQRILDARPDLWPVLEKAIGDGGSERAGAVVEEFWRIEAGVRAINELGCVLRCINAGLVDFLSWRGGRDVWLCWQYGEPEVAYWRELQARFDDRQPL